jgi:hypothetical protein
VVRSQVGVQARDRYCGATEGADSYFLACDERNIV